LPESAIWGSSTPGILDFSQGTLIPDLGGPRVAEELFRCASDEEPRQVSAYHTTRLRNFSYVFTSDVVDGFDNKGWKSKRITKIRCPARKVLFYENGDSLGLDSTPVVYDAGIFKETAHPIIGLRHRN